MASFATVWTSPSTSRAQVRVAQALCAARGADVRHDSLSTAGCNATESKESLDGAFNRLVSMSMADPTLHIVAVVPLFESTSASQIQTLYDACSALEHNFTLHIIGLAYGVKRIFSAETESTGTTGDFSAAMRLLESLSENAPFCMSFTIIDDYAENGAAIGFTLGSLSDYIALIHVAMMQDYYKIMSPALLTSHPGYNLSIGVSSLSFNRAAATRQLLGRGFLEALDSVGINNKEVDAQKAAREAESFLAGISERYPTLFEHSVRPLYKEEGVDKGRVVAQASPILDDEINALKNEILSLLKCGNLSLPEKEAVLAMILGRDNENIRGMQYEHEGALLDDACEQPINLYVEAFNRSCRTPGVLPLRGEFKALNKYVWDESSGKYEESAENFMALNPLPDIKRLKQEIINITAFIRDKQDEIESLQRSAKLRDDAEDIRSKWHRPEGALKDVEYKEQPLDRQYTPPPGLKIKQSVDLRKFFTPVKNQFELGSCTSFAAVAMYEAMMNRAGGAASSDMSPAYLYYYSNVLKGRPSGGSNFYEQLEVLGSHGVCREDLYVYDTDAIDTRPSEQAEEDAKSHRVISAEQIPLVNTPDKADTLRRNHILITSALSEGYPVGISLKVYDNLGKDGAFILHPDDAPDAKEEGWHAMVAVGYSEENNFYIVRNSWGPEFGEEGYCYIPTAYIDDPDYMDFACIITEISDSAEGVKADIPAVIANFAATESEIRMAAIRNAIVKVRIDLRNSQKLYAEYYKYYQRLMMQLTIPKVQNEIRAAAEEDQIKRINDLNEKKRKLEDTFVERLGSFRHILRCIIVALAVIVSVCGLTWYYIRNYTSFVSFLISGGICLFTILGYKWWIRIRRRELQEELDRIAVFVHHQEQELLEMQIRFHVAGMWIHRFRNLSLEISNVYDRLVSYNSTLRAWQEMYSRQIGAPEVPEGQMFRVLDASPLLQGFFEQNKKAIVREVDLIKLFESYQIDPESLEKSHQELRNTVTSVIESFMADFNIAAFLLGDACPYLNPVSLQDEISALISVGQPSYRNKAMYATSAIHIIICNVPRERENSWSAAIAPLFPMLPVRLPVADPTTLILLTIHPQKTDS